MDEHIFASWLEDRPELLLRAAAFNRAAGAEPAAVPDIAPALVQVLQRHPDLLEACGDCEAQPSGEIDEGFWDFAEPTRRLALMSSAELHRLAMFAAAALLADDIARCVRRDDVRRLREAAGDEAVDYALGLGRWQTGGLAEAIWPFMHELLDDPIEGRGPLEASVPRLAGALLAAFRRTWPDELQRRAQPRFDALPEGLAAGLGAQQAVPDLGAEELRRLWNFFKKLIFREFKSWTPFFE